MPKKKPAWEWSASRRRYLQQGREVPEKKIRAGVQAAVNSGKDEIGDLTQQLVDKKISLDEWEVRMREQIRAGHRAVTMIAYGGKLTPSATGKLGAVVREQYKYLSAFRQQIEDGTAPLGKRTVARARQYGQAMMATYSNAVIARERKAGVLKARWTLSAAEHCAGCLEQNARGVLPIEDFPPIGSQECKSNCLCSIEPV